MIPFLATFTSTFIIWPLVPEIFPEKIYFLFFIFIFSSLTFHVYSKSIESKYGKPLIWLIRFLLYLLAFLLFFYLRDLWTTFFHISLGMVSTLMGTALLIFYVPELLLSIGAATDEELWKDLIHLAEAGGGAGGGFNAPAAGNPPIQPPAAANPQPPAAVLHEVENVLNLHSQLERRIPLVFRSAQMRAPGGYQAERLAEMLEEHFGAENLGTILVSLTNQGANSPYFEGIKSDFVQLKNDGWTDAALRRRWNGLDD